MSKAIICVGPSGSGKSTWARAHVENDPNYLRINRDDLRSMRGKYWLPKQEKLITKWQKEMADIAIKAGHSLVIDDTNLNEKTRDGWKQFFRDRGVEVSEKDFTNVPMSTCIQRDLKRPNSVGADVIKEQFRKYIDPVRDPLSVIVQDSSLPKCIIVDCDGTLNKVTNRSPYDGTNCHLDEANEHVVEVVQMLSNKYHVIVMSGLEDKYRSQREAWLDNHDVPVFALYMRKTGDVRGDDIIKKELFEEHVRGKFYVHCIIDDRPKMVRAWRRMGFTDRILAVGDQDIDF